MRSQNNKAGHGHVRLEFQKGIRTELSDRPRGRCRDRRVLRRTEYQDGPRDRRGMRLAHPRAGYILPADKQATVKVDATTIVQMHNEFRDTPKTGDDFNLGLWVSLAALSVVGAGVLGFVGYKNRKKKKED